jgi:transposase
MSELSGSDRVECQRALALIAEVDEPVIPVSKQVYRVHSQSRGGYHTVARKQIGWVCDCGQFELLHTACKHIWAVRIWLRPGDYHGRNLRVSLSRPNYSQDWPAYDAAQQEEHSLFDPLLWDLLTTVPEPNREIGAKGRPPVPRRTQFLMAVKKVHVGESSRRARGLLKVIYSSGEGLIPCIPNYAVPSRLFNRPDTGDLLLDLIRLSAFPLREIEDGGTVAIDSTGFCTTCMGAYCTEKHDPSRKHRWVKAHVIVGVRTHAILDVRITDENGADCPRFVELLRGVKFSGFNPSTVVADKAYLSFENYSAADELGLDVRIPFKVTTISNEVRQVRGVRAPKAWENAYHLFQLNRERFAAGYHQRSNVETVFSAVKRKMGEALLSKNQVARFNELLAKLLAYNIGVIVHEIYEHGIEPKSLGLAPSPPPEPPTPMGNSGIRPCDSIPGPVTETGWVPN